MTMMALLRLRYDGCRAAQVGGREDSSGVSNARENGGEVLHAMGGPRFQDIVGLEVFEGLEGELGDGSFVGGDVFGVEVEEVDDAEMDAADRVTVIVDEANDALGVIVGDVKFFVDFAFDARHVEVTFERGHLFVLGVDVAADADGTPGGEALLAGFAAADVAQEASLVVKNGVGDDLLVARVVFGEVALEKEVVLGVEDEGEVVVGVGIEAVEVSEFVEEAAFDDEDFFVGVFVAHWWEHSTTNRGADARIFVFSFLVPCSLFSR